MRGLDLHVFDFDYDLTWQALFLRPDGTALGRFGGRDADTPGKYRSLSGLRHAMRQALDRHRQPTPRPPRMPPAEQHAEDYPAARRLSAQSCIHCHHVAEFRREERQRAGTWKAADEWVYPQPENVGLTLDVRQGDRVVGVRADSSAARAGLQPGDVLTALHRQPVASVADVQYALHQAPAVGAIPVAWQRHGKPFEGRLHLAAGWRETDLSWRHSLHNLPPGPGLHGEDLTADEKQKLGLPPGRLAFRQGGFLSPSARHAGVRVHDVVLGFDDRPLYLTARQFEAFVRLNYRVGDTVIVNIVRDGRPLRLPMRLVD